MSTYEFFASNEFISDIRTQLILVGTECQKFSHVGIIENNSAVFHATHLGFHEESLSDFIEQHGFVHRFELNVEYPMFAAGWLRGSIGKDYPELALLGLEVDRWRWIPRWLASLIKVFVSDGKSKYICTEAALRFGVECCGLSLDNSPEFVTPSECVEIMRKIGKTNER